MAATYQKAINMNNATPSYKLRANANYEAKLTRKNVIFKQTDDADLLADIAADAESFTPLVKRLLREHYKQSKNQ